MPNFADLITEKGKAPDQQIRKIQRLMGEIEEEFTHRPLIAYAADINKFHPDAPNLIYHLDKTMFADLLDSVGTSENLDMLLQSPGGYPDATEQLVSMLRGRFSSVHFYVPHTAKSAATMMVCSGDKIYMDHRSELGPIDPQIRIPKAGGVFISVPAQAYLDGFDRINQELNEAGRLSPAYIPVLNQVDVAILQMCRDAIEHSKALVKTWLQDYMLSGQADAEARANEVVDKLSDYRTFLSHGRPLGVREAQELGLAAEDLRDAPELQAKVWELYCRIELLFDGTPWVKILGSKDFWIGKLAPRQFVRIPVPQQIQPDTRPQPSPSPAPDKSRSRGSRGKKKQRVKFKP